MTQPHDISRADRLGDEILSAIETRFRQAETRDEVYRTYDFLQFRLRQTYDQHIQRTYA